VSVWIVISVFIAMLGLGAWAGRGVKDLRAFALSKGYFSSFALFATIVASFVGGGVIVGTAEKSFLSGIGYAGALLGFSAQLIITALFFSPRLARMNNVLTIGDVVRSSYGKAAQILTGLLWLSFCIGILVAQMSVLGKTLSLFFPWDYTTNVLFGGGVVIVYSLLGGMRAVVITDVVQFILFAVMVPLALVFGISEVGGLNVLWSKLPEGHLSLLGNMDGLAFIGIFLSFLLGDALIPPVVQRMLMAKNSRQALVTTFWGGWMTIPLIAFSAGLGLVAYALNPELDSGRIIPYLFQSVLPVWLQGLAVAGILSVIMSSADSYLNAAAVVLVNDVVHPLTPKKLSDGIQLGLARWLTLVLGGVAITFSLVTRDILDILLHTYKFWGPTVVIPIVLSVLGKALSKRAFFLAFLAGTGTVVLWDVFGLEDTLQLSGLVPGILVNALVCGIAWLAAFSKGK